MQTSGEAKTWQYYDEVTEHAYKDPTLGPDVRNAFDGPPSTTGLPRVAYPLSGAVHPMNLGEMTIHFERGSAEQQLFRIDLLAGGAGFHFYVPCTTEQCVVPLPEPEWLDLGQRYKGASIELQVTGTAGRSAPVSTSASIAVAFSEEPVLGALYYWAAGSRSIKRAAFGAKKAVNFISPNSATSEFACVACHSVSRDGKVIAFAVSELDGENTAAIQTAPTDAPEQPFVRPVKGKTPFAAGLAHNNTVGPTDHLGHNVALSPDGSIAAVNGVSVGGWPPFFELRTTRTGATVKKWDLGDNQFGPDRLPIFPEWSPDGKSLVVTLANGQPDYQCIWTSLTCNSEIAVMSYEGSELGKPRVLVAKQPDVNHFYPTWSPDGKFVAFVSALAAPPGSDPLDKQRGKSISNPTGVLRLVRAAGGPYTCPGPDCYDLTRGTRYTPEDAKAGRAKHSTWPKFAPFEQGSDGSKMFISFTSKIDYGLVSQDTSQLWMFAVDVGSLKPGQDPSSAPIWLPYQEATDGSLAPYWTEVLPCSKDPNGGCKGCVNGESCVVDTKNQCSCAALVK